MFKLIDPALLTYDDISKWYAADTTFTFGPTGGGPGAPVTVSSGQPVGKSPEQVIGTALPDYLANLAYYNGDHWQNGTAWSGQFPYKPGSETDVDEKAMQRIRQGLVSENLIAESTDRHTSSVVGRSPAARTYTAEDKMPKSKAGEDKPKDPLVERNEVLATYLQRRDVTQTLQKFARTLLLGRKATLRVYLPPGLLARLNNLTELAPGTPLTVPKQASYKEALSLLRVEVIEPGGGGVYEDPDTGERYAAALRTSNGQSYAELSYVKDGKTVITYVQQGTDAAGTTAPADGTAPAPRTGRIEATGVNLGGHLPLYTRERNRPLITEQVRSLQKLVNKALTMASGNLDWSGFLERIIINGNPPKRKLPDGTEVIAYEAGPGTASFINGLKQVDGEGKVTFTTPSVVFREPIKADVFEQTVDMARRGFLHETFQLHALISGDASPTGESRRQAMADFLLSLLLTKPHVDGAGLWLMEVLDRWAGEMCAEPTGDDARFTFRTRLDPGPMTPEDVQAVVSKVKEGLISQRTALGELRYEDVEAELAAIEAEVFANAGRLSEMLTALTEAGFSLEGALRYLRVPDDEIERILSFTEPKRPVPPELGGPPVPPVDETPEEKAERERKEAEDAEEEEDTPPR